MSASFPGLFSHLLLGGEKPWERGCIVGNEINNSWQNGVIEDERVPVVDNAVVDNEVSDHAVSLICIVKLALQRPLGFSVCACWGCGVEGDVSVNF